MIPSNTKITVIGAGAIGSTILYTLMLKELASEIILINRNKAKGYAKASDISHCTGLCGNSHILSGDYEDSKNSDIVIITAGVLPDEHGSRMDVLSSNIKIYKDIIPEVVKYSPNCVLLILTNPVDVMAYAAYKISGFPASKVIGTGTLLDTTRLRSFLGEQLKINVKDINTMVIGEHGESQFPIWSNTEMCINEELKKDLEHKTKRAGWNIRLANEHSCYAISLSAVKIVEAILEKNNDPIPVSVLLNGQYDIKNVYLSLPAKLNNKGIESIIEPELNELELEKLKNSSKLISDFITQADKYL